MSRVLHAVLNAAALEFDALRADIRNVSELAIPAHHGQLEKAGGVPTIAGVVDSINLIRDPQGLGPRSDWSVERPAEVRVADDLPSLPAGWNRAVEVVSPAAGGAITKRGDCIGAHHPLTGGYGSATYHVTVPGAGIPVGSTVIVYGHAVSASRQLVSVTDDRGNIYNVRANAVGPTIFLADAQITTALSADEQIHVTMSGIDTVLVVNASWFSTCYFDALAAPSTYAGTAGSGGTITTRAASELVLGFFGVYDSTSPVIPSISSPGAGYTNQPGYGRGYDMGAGDRAALGIDWESKIGGAAAGTETATATMSQAGGSRRAMTVAYSERAVMKLRSAPTRQAGLHSLGLFVQSTEAPEITIVLESAAASGVAVAQTTVPAGAATGWVYVTLSANLLAGQAYDVVIAVPSVPRVWITGVCLAPGWPDSPFSGDTARTERHLYEWTAARNASVSQRRGQLIDLLAVREATAGLDIAPQGLTVSQRRAYLLARRRSRNHGDGKTFVTLIAELIRTEDSSFQNSDVRIVEDYANSSIQVQIGYNPTGNLSARVQRLIEDIKPMAVELTSITWGTFQADFGQADVTPL